MIKAFASGGLGDAAIVLAKIKSDKMTCDDFKIYHAEMHLESLPYIAEFYKSQGINAQCMYAPKGNAPFYYNNSSKYDITISSNWSGLNGFPADDWEIEPFPAISFKKMPFDLAIQVAAGRSQSRRLTHNELCNFLSRPTDKRIVLVGNTDDKEIAELQGNFVNLVNNTTMSEYISAICSADIFIGHAGFGAYIACMSGSKSYVVPEHCSHIYFHPRWHFQLINNIRDIGDLGETK